MSPKQTADNQFRKFVHKINVEQYDGPKIAGPAATRLMEASRKQDADRFRTSDKSDRATTELVFYALPISHRDMLMLA